MSDDKEADTPERSPPPSLGCQRRPLLPMVLIPEAVELCEVHVRLHTTILVRLQGVAGPGTEEAPV